MGRKRIRKTTKSAPKPSPLTDREKATLSSILKKARAFKRYYAAQKQPGTV